MPEICRFYGIVIRMYVLDHAPPYFHAVYGEHEALIGIEDLATVRGRLPNMARARREQRRMGIAASGRTAGSRGNGPGV